MFISLRFENVKSQQCLFECEVAAMFIRLCEVTAMFIQLRFENVKSQQCLFECEVAAMFIRM